MNRRRFGICTVTLRDRCRTLAVCMLIYKNDPDRAPNHAILIWNTSASDLHANGRELLCFFLLLHTGVKIGILYAIVGFKDDGAYM